MQMGMCLTVAGDEQVISPLSAGEGGTVPFYGSRVFQGDEATP